MTCFRALFIPFALLSPGLSIVQADSLQLRDPWDAIYQAADATDPHVIALWQFEPGDENVDHAKNIHHLQLRGGNFTPKGRFGGGLESFRGFPIRDKPHGARAKNHPDLTPQGGFTIEFWLQPKPEFKEDVHCYLIDKKYVADDDYQITLSRADRNGSRTLQANLGFGGNSESFPSKPLKIEIGQWYHLAFTYDGEGTGTFYINGKDRGSTLHPGRKSISPGKHALVIGDRIGSNYAGFPGILDQVRLCTGVREFRDVRLTQTNERTTFRRMESNVTLPVELTNLRTESIRDAFVTLAIDGRPETRLDLPDIQSSQTHTLEYPLDTRLRPNDYVLQARVVSPGSEKTLAEQRFPVTIVQRQPPDRFPVLMWGVYNPKNVLNEMDQLKTIGFTHVLGMGADYGKIWEEKQPTIAAKPETLQSTQNLLNEALKQDLTIMASLSPGHHLESHPEFLRITREGKSYKRKNICGLTPGIREFCYNAGASLAQTYSAFPAWGGALVHTEIRDGAQACFHPHDRDAYQKKFGTDIPEQITAKWGVKWNKLKDFPSDRVIPDDDPLLQYLRWYFKEGDGWNGLNTAVHDGLMTAGRDDIWTFNDPAVRVASTYGSGGNVDTLSHWTYTYPDPLRIGLCTDQLLAMAGGAGQLQNVMKMTQIIWYRSGTAPVPKPDAEPLTHTAPWEVRQPNAPFITIAPMHLREALWTKIARPIRGIMYHGWQSLVPTDSTSGYRFTHPQTQHELARLIQHVIQPLGPTLLNVPGIQSDVAILDSFTSQMFAGRGTYGWGNGWLADVHHVLQYAHIQPEIIYDETILQRGLKDFRVLVLADCDVLTRSVVDKINAFQAQGGIIVADERITPAIQPDLKLKVYLRTKNAHDDKGALVEIARTLRKNLDARYSRPVDTSDPDAIPYLRRYHSTDYVFLVNDRREAGDYVGHHGLVMESGKPTDATVSLRRPTGFVYDLVNATPVETVSRQGRLEFKTRLGPCDGGLFAVLDRPIDRIQIEIPDNAARGETVRCLIKVLTPEGQPIDAVIPVKIDILDAQTRPAEFTGHHAAINGTINLNLDIAPNESHGVWQITAREGATGRRATHYLTITE